MKEIKTGTVLVTEGEKFLERSLIMKGNVRAVAGGLNLLFRAGDVIGLCEADKDEALFEYRAETDLNILPFTGDKDQFKAVMEKNNEIARYCISSLFRQMNDIRGRCGVLRVESDTLWQYVRDCYDRYVASCEEDGSMPEQLPGYEELQKPEFEQYPPEWYEGYYATMEQMLSVWDYNKTDYDFIYGFIVKTAEDMQEMVSYCKEVHAYREELCRYLMTEDEADLFRLYTNMYMAKMEEGVPTERLLALKIKIKEIVSFAQKYCETEAASYQARMEEFEKNVMELEKQNNDKTMENAMSNANVKEILAEISGSLDKILAYAECGEQVAASFKKFVLAYKKMSNKNSSDDMARKLRHELATLFYKVYTAAFQVSIKDREVPVLIKMLFNFGYVDEELAGVNNAVQLYQLAKNMPTSPEKGVYSMYEWLMAIYTGQKEPGRNEFDMDYGEYLREQRKMGKISEAQERSLIDNKASKVLYELENVFPSVNKISFGRPSTFCPLFSKHNILKPLESVIVTEEKITDIIQSIRFVDFGAFYRETMYAEPDKGIPKEVIQVEVLPDVILAPNIGTRGVMWQEVEGKKRTTPARMICSVFQLEDLLLTMIRLTAEFRWEMCKRIQGGRWNDVTERSLTSEYCDYAQFYKKNKDLSTDTKEKIKVQLTKARNNFKEMFIVDYISWVRYESAGSPRLNKLVRNILYTYCPFPKAVASKLVANPMYKEIVDKHNIRTAQKIHHAENVCKKLTNMGKPIPEEYENYKKFLEM